MPKKIHNLFLCSLQCSYGCKPTPVGPRCYCPYGKKPEANKCVDADECEWDETCAQICENTPGSFKCSCVSGYQSEGTDCIAINCEYIFLKVSAPECKGDVTVRLVFLVCIYQYNLIRYFLCYRRILSLEKVGCLLIIPLQIAFYLHAQ